jgi:hypothetical protein
MSASIISGPSIVTGNTNPNQVTDPDQGPSLAFQGSGLIDPRFVGSLGAAPGNKIYGLYANSYVASTDAVPVVLSNTRIAAGQAVTAATPMTLISAQGAGVALGLPILPFGASPQAGNIVTAGVTLDHGFVAGSVNGTTTLTIPAGAWRFFNKGQRIIVAGAKGTGATGGNLVTTVAVQPAAGATTITMADAATVTNSLVQIGNAHPIVDAFWPYLTAGVDALFDASQGLARAVSITGNTGSTAQNFTVRGYDIYGQAMTEVIAFAGGAATTNGKKAFKHITSVTPASTDAGHSLSVGTTDIIGFNFRTDYWEYINAYVAGAFVTVNTGWVVADATLPATSSTGDVRGTYALQTASNWDGTVANWASSRRVALFSSMPTFNVVNATNLCSAAPRLKSR